MALQLSLLRNELSGFNAVLVTIREAMTDDLDDLAALLAEVNNLHASALPHIYRRVATSPETADYLRRIIASEELHLFVAEAADQVVGFLIMQAGHAPPTPVHVPRKWVIIDTVVVLEAFRRRGIGEALIQHAHAWARSQDIDRVELMVADFNSAAIAWYEKLGYTTRYRRMELDLGDGEGATDAG